MGCENCIIENEFDPSIHKIENGPFDTQAECEDSKNSPVAFFSIDIDTPSIFSEGQDLVITDLVIKLTDQNLIDSAIRQIAGLEPKKYLRGNIVDEFAWYNPEYLYHVDPSSIYFVDMQALGNNQQDLEPYRLQAGRQLSGNVTVQSAVTPEEPDCEDCANTVYIGWLGYCTCSSGTEAQECLTKDCGVYMPDPNNPKKTIWKEKHVCVQPKPYEGYVWNNIFCEWVCPGNNSSKTVDQVKAECENRSILGLAQSSYTFKPETCECVPPTTCAPCKTDGVIDPLRCRPLKSNGQSGYIYVNDNNRCTACKCRENDNFGISLCGPKGKIANTQTCECECNEATACPGDLKELVTVNKWTPSIEGANLYPPCDCKCKEPCTLPLVQNDDTCECNCPTGPLPVYKCTKNGQTSCVECNTNANFIYNPTSCTCECVVNCPSPKIQESPTSCNCICPAEDIQCLCSYSSNGNPDGLSDSQVMCPDNKEYIIRQNNGQCDCVCKNPKTNEECGPGKVWNEIDCKCECATNHASCLFGQEFNEDTCECECPTAIFNESFVSGTVDQESLQCLYEVTCYRCEECPTGRTRNLAREIIQGKSCPDFVYDIDKHYFNSCDDCETLDIVTDAELTDVNTITATISKITSTGGAESFDEIEIELAKSNPDECCSEAVLNKTVKRTLYGYSLKSVSTTQIPTNPETCS